MISKLKTWAQNKLGFFDCGICNSRPTEDGRYTALKAYYFKIKRFRYLIIRGSSTEIERRTVIDPHFTNNPNLIARFKYWESCKQTIVDYDTNKETRRQWNYFYDKVRPNRVS